MRWIVFLAAFVSCATSLAAQDVVLHSGTSEILVDVVVRDKHGRPVHGLSQQDFRVFEDNAAQRVTSWREVRGGMSPGQTQPAAGEIFVQGHKSDNSAVHLSRQVRLVSLVFDKLSDTGRRLARAGALDFLVRDAGPNVYYAVFFVDRSFKVIQTYTNNMDLLRAAVEHATGLIRAAPNSEAGGLELLAQQTAAAVGSADSAGGGPGAPSVNGGALADEQANTFTDNMLQLSDQLNRTDLGQISIFSLWAIIKQLERLPGRKSVLYFSEGYSMPGDLWMQFASLISAANRANVTVDAVDARGLIPSSDTDLAQQLFSKGLAMSNHMTRSRGGASAVGDYRAGDYELDSLRGNGQMVLRELAESTGGELIANVNDLRPQLQRLSEDFNSWYELTYKAANPDYDGRFRSIGVTLAGRHPGYTIQARSGYFALPPMEGQFVFPYEVPLLRALAQHPLPRSLDFSAAIIPFHHLPNGQIRSSLVFDLPLKPVEFTWDEKSKKYVTHLSVLSLIKDERGNVVAKLSRDVALGEAKEQLEAFRQGRFIVTLPVDLQPGRYTVESVAADQRSGRMGARRASFFAGARRDGPELSGLTLLRRLEKPSSEPDARDPLQIPEGRIVPTLSKHVPLGKGTLLSIFFELYPDVSSRQSPRLVIDLLREGKIVSRSTPELTASTDGAGIPYLANLPVGSLQPGQYEFRARLLQGAAGDQKTIAVTLE